VHLKRGAHVVAQADNACARLLGAPAPQQFIFMLEPLALRQELG